MYMLLLLLKSKFTLLFSIEKPLIDNVHVGVCFYGIIKTEYKSLKGVFPIFQ